MSYRGAKTTLILDLARRGVNQTVKEALMRRRAFRPALAFHGLTPLYDRANDLLGFGAPFLGRVIDALGVRGDEQLLDIGCGTGSLLRALGERHARMRLTGIDADPRVLHDAHDKLSAAGVRAALVLAFAQDLPFASGSFDVATSTLIFHHLSTDAKRAALAEIRRVLTPEGRFLLADFGRPQTALQWTLLSVGRLFDGFEGTRVNLQGRLPEMLREAGFQVEEAGSTYRAVQFLRAVPKR